MPLRLVQVNYKARDDSALARLEALGATLVDIGQGEAARWKVLTNPRGNEFCVLAPA